MGCECVCSYCMLNLCVWCYGMWEIGMLNLCVCVKLWYGEVIVWSYIEKVVCEVIVCEVILYVKFVCVKLLYGEKVVCEVIVWRWRREAGGGGGRRRRSRPGIQNQKQEPHTKLWGIIHKTHSCMKFAWFMWLSRFCRWPEQVYNFIWLGKNMRHVYTAFILSNKKYWRLFHHGYIHKISPYQQMHCQEGSCWTIELPYALYPHCPYILRLNCEVCVLLPSRRPWTFEQAASWWLAQAFYTFCIVDEWF